MLPSIVTAAVHCGYNPSISEPLLNLTAKSINTEGVETKVWPLRSSKLSTCGISLEVISDVLKKKKLKYYLDKLSFI